MSTKTQEKILELFKKLSIDDKIEVVQTLSKERDAAIEEITDAYKHKIEHYINQKTKPSE